MPWALIQGGAVVQVAATKFDVNPALSWAACPAGTSPGDVYDGASFAHPAPTTPPGPRYVPLATIRERVTASGKWNAFAAALDGLSSDKKWHLLTLQEGIASDDADATALLTACGCDPAAVLAP